MNNRVMFGKDENDWREYEWYSEEKERNVRVYWSVMECREVFSHRLFTDVFMVKSEVGGTMIDGLALIQYHAIMAGSSKFANMV